MEDQSRAGVALALAAYGTWGLLTLYWHGLQGLNAFELIGHRVLWTTVVLAVALTVRRRWAFVHRVRAEPRLLARLVVAAVLLTLNWTSYVWAVTHGNVVEAALGYFMSPLGMVAVGVVVMNERLRPAQAVALALGAAAVVVLTVAYGKVPWFALAMAASWVAYATLKKTVPLGPLESLAAEAFALVPAAVVIVLIGAAHGGGALARADATQVALVLGLGAITAAPLVTFAAAAQRAKLTTLGLTQYLVPTINFALGVAVYHEAVPAERLAGFALVWVGLAVLTADTLGALRRTQVLARA